MSPQVQAVKLITPELVQEHLADALRIVTELEIEGDLREPAFVQACQMLAARATVVEQPAPFGISPGEMLGRGRGR